MKVKITIEGFDDIENENISNINTLHNKTIEQINHTTLKFFRLFSGLETDEVSKKNLYLRGYITAITNNFLICKKLFIGGWHFQLQIILRTQFEQITNLLVMTFDDEFFEYFTTNKGNDQFLPFTPKQTHLNKAIKRIKIKNPEHGKVFEQYIKEMQTAYEEFSASVHGNFLQTMLLSTHHDEKENINFSIGGSKQAYPRTENYIRGVLNFSQLMLSAIERKLLDDGLLNFDNLGIEIDIDSRIMYLDNI
ncbi:MULTISPECIES: hypothetical protein [Flavobacterium]|uniref:hypothetical protein n=1 Tax=Flavobacterium TaxID=237 RepID=UPI001FCB3DC7|nr:MULTISPECIES: hypothetical protein [Flavobacterium]UOK42128.1 hypothetical protein LZF87_12515 [Flavobacterium enshiense]